MARRSWAACCGKVQLPASLPEEEPADLPPKSGSARAGETPPTCLRGRPGRETQTFSSLARDKQQACELTRSD